MSNICSEAKDQALKVLCSPFIPEKAVRALITAGEKGRIIGREYSHCFFGIIAASSGLVVSDIKIHFGFSSLWIENPIEVFCLSICSGQTPKKNTDVMLLVDWAETALKLRNPAVGDGKTEVDEFEGEVICI